MNKLTHYISTHSSEIMVGIGVSGYMVASFGFVNATLKSYKQVLEKKQELGVDKLSKKEVFKLCWKNYIIPTTLTLGSTGLILVGENKAIKRNASLMAACTLTETALIDYKNKTRELIGEEASKKIQESIVKDKAEVAVKEEKNIIVANEETDVLMFEPITATYFKSTWNKVARVANELVANAQGSFGTITLNDWLYALGLETSSIGDTIGWFCNDRSSMLSVYSAGGITSSNKAYVAICYVTEPTAI